MPDDNLRDRFPNYNEQGLIIEDYLQEGFFGNKIVYGTTMPSSLEQYFLTTMSRQRLFPSITRFFDHAYVIKRSTIEGGDIQTISPYIGNLTKSIDPEGQLADIRNSQKQVNQYLTENHNPRHAVKYAFIFINQTFYGSESGTIMGVFYKKGTLPLNKIIKRHGLTDESTVDWLALNNDANHVRAYTKKDGKRSSVVFGVVEFVGEVLSVVIF